MFKRELALDRSHFERLEEGGDVKVHIRMGELWQDCPDSGAYRDYSSQDPDVVFLALLLDSSPPSWSNFVATREGVLDTTYAPRSTIIGHILDLNELARGRADAHAGQPRERRW
jgi:hypothetical protein